MNLKRCPIHCRKGRWQCNACGWTSSEFDDCRPVDVQCEHGRTQPPPVETRRRTRQMDCQHLGGRIGDTKLMAAKDCSCGQQSASVFGCEVRGLCAPFGHGRLIDDAIADCLICRKYEDQNNGTDHNADQ